ncbi:GDSL-type esterase/lipase family protein [uncultured Muribaculum sp.]|uniref:SGNH/GDSL hydrolase family protein n=1 Tax=uncultured Muribaculum sp. TaxID=1918613 RepID=UPI00259509D6|nr:GDSL-type esterase/lipase family protein [uncultured Muribaculum sp.]
MKYLHEILVAFAVLFLLSSCSDDVKDARLDFVGDSIVARWDLAEYFPSRLVYNYGKSGAGIEYLESLAGRFADRNVVVMIGTNNNYLFVETDREDYARRYVDAITALDAKRVYLYSVLPRDFTSDRDDVNDDIAEFNAVVKHIVESMPAIVYMDVYDDFLHDGKIDFQLYSDKLHLSPYGYEILTKTLLQEL